MANTCGGLKSSPEKAILQFHSYAQCFDSSLFSIRTLKCGQSTFTRHFQGFFELQGELREPKSLPKNHMDVQKECLESWNFDQICIVFWLQMRFWVHEQWIPLKTRTISLFSFLLDCNTTNFEAFWYVRSCAPLPPGASSNGVGVLILWIDN